MIKVLYDETGSITDFWAVERIPDSAFIEISEDVHKQIVDKDNYIVQNGKLLDISYTEAYKSQKLLEAKIESDLIIKNKILELEQKQNRSLREIILSGDDLSKSKLCEIESEIISLREQL